MPPVPGPRLPTWRKAPGKQIGQTDEERCMKRVACCFRLVLVGATLLAAGCSQEKAATQARPAPRVGVMTVAARDTPVTGTYVGQTEGSRAVEVRAQVSGILTSRTYEEGQYVEQGQLLFTIEPDTYKANLAQAEGMQAQAQARFVQAKQDLDRVRPLYAKNAVSQRDRDQAQAAYNAAKADLESARAAVDDARIKLGHAYVTAPVSGFTSKEYRSVGNLITAGAGNDSRLTVINKIDPIYANFSIPSPDYMHMQVLRSQGRLRFDKQEAALDLADGSRYPAPGAINFIDKQVNPNTSVVAARAEFPNSDSLVLPGQFVRVTISGPVLVNAILIPQQAVLQTQKGSMVVVVGDNDIAEMRPVKLGQAYGGDFLVDEGLKPGERIVVEGTNKAQPGQPVSIVQAEEPEAREEGTK